MVTPRMAALEAATNVKSLPVMPSSTSLWFGCQSMALLPATRKGGARKLTSCKAVESATGEY